VLRTTELVTDVTRLLEPYGLGLAGELVQIKRAGERVALDRDVVDRWRPRLDDLFALLDRARDGSPLPEEPTNRGEIEAWLVDHRLAELAR
jgi:uncharacterized protein